jgi:hypothetical protein
MKKNKQQQSWNPGDCFLIPLKDGTFLIAQILAAETAVLNSVSCALFDQRSDGKNLDRPNPAKLFSTVLTTRDLLDSGDWKILATVAVEVPREKFPFEALREIDFVGAKVIGSRNINEFANAFCGLVPWDDWADPAYLDRLLLSTDLKPKNLMFKA